MSRLYPLVAVIEDIQQLCLSLSTQRAVAKYLGISEQYLSDVLKGRRDPGEALLRRLGWKKVVGYQFVGKDAKDANDIDR